MTTINRFCCLFVALVLISGLTPALAAKRVDLYSDSQLVLDQSDSLRQQAAAKGLETVFVRVSGNEQVLNHPLVQQALVTANDFLVKYSYNSTDEVITIAGESRAARNLTLQYSAPAVQRVLQNAGLPNWPEVRPEVLLWVVSEQQGKRQLVGSESLSSRALKQAGVQSGLPIVMPALDLSDRQRLSPSRLWLLDERAIANASARYGADAVLAGRLVPVANNQWQARFLLQHNNKNLIFNETGIGARATAEQIVKRVAAYLASLQAIVVNSQSDAPSVMIQVNNVHRFEDYAALMNYLNDLAIVANVTVHHVEKNQVLLDIAYSGTEGKLFTTLASSSLIQRLADPVNVNVPATTATPPIDATTPRPSANTKPVVQPTSQPKALFTWRSTDVQ